MAIAPLTRSANRAQGGTFSNTGCAWQEWWPVASTMDLDSQGAIPLGAQNMVEQDSSRARSTAPNCPFKISCKADEGKVSIPPCIAHASGLVCCKISCWNQRSPWAGPHCWIGLSIRPYMRGWDCSSRARREGKSTQHKRTSEVSYIKCQ